MPFTSAVTQATAKAVLATMRAMRAATLWTLTLAVMMTPRTKRAMLDMQLSRAKMNLQVCVYSRRSLCHVVEAESYFLRFR